VPTDFPRLWRSPYGLLTENAVMGVKVYGEKLFTHKGRELRAWNPRRSKLAAFILKGGKRIALKGDERVLYLGAASGTTVSHLSDMLREGQVLAVEKSARSFRDLINVARVRENILPSLTDARHLDALAALMPGGVDVLYQDIAQRDQAEIFLEAAKRYLRPGGLGILMVKARSVSISAEPRVVYDRIEKTIRDAGYSVVERIELEPWELDHAALVVRGPEGDA
jgi:fibrillarin-like pre-rRNA processing protein